MAHGILSLFVAFGSLCTHPAGVLAVQAGVVSLGLPQSVRQPVQLQGSLVQPVYLPTLGWRAAALRSRTAGAHLDPSALWRRIPAGVRLAGPEAVSQYLETRHLSHRLSVKNHPQLAAHPGNLVFERGQWNLARGANDMTWSDRLRVRFDNSLAGGAAGARALFPVAARGAGLGILVALPVEALVAWLDIQYGRATEQQALQDAATTVGIVALTSGGVASVIALTYAQGFVLGAPVLVPLTVAAGSVFVWVSGERIWQALDGKQREVVRKWRTVATGAIQERSRAITDSASDWATATFDRMRGGVELLRVRGSDLLSKARDG